MKLKDMLPIRGRNNALIISMKHPAGFRCYFPADQAPSIHRKSALLKNYIRKVERSAALMEKLSAEVQAQLFHIADYRYPARKADAVKTADELLQDIYRLTVSALTDYGEIMTFRDPIDLDPSCVPPGNSSRPSGPESQAE